MKINKIAIEEAFLKVMNNNKQLKEKIFGKDNVPSDFSNITIEICSLDFTELLIELEDMLGCEFAEKFAEKCMLGKKLTIKELVERVEKIV